MESFRSRDTMVSARFTRHARGTHEGRKKVTNRSILHCRVEAEKYGVSIYTCLSRGIHTSQSSNIRPRYKLTGTGHTRQYPLCRAASPSKGRLIDPQNSNQAKFIALFAGPLFPGAINVKSPVSLTALATRTSARMPTGCTQKNPAKSNRTAFALTLAYSGSAGTRPICTSPEKKNAVTVNKAYRSSPPLLSPSLSDRYAPGPETACRSVWCQ